MTASGRKGCGRAVENERPRIARMKRIFLSPKAIKKHRKPLEGKGDSYESSCHQRPACLRASSLQSNADTMNPTGPPFLIKEKPRTSRSEKPGYHKSTEEIISRWSYYFSQIARISQIGAAGFSGSKNRGFSLRKFDIRRMVLHLSSRGRKRGFQSDDWRGKNEVRSTKLSERVFMVLVSMTFEPSS